MFRLFDHFLNLAYPITIVPQLIAILLNLFAIHLQHFLDLLSLMLLSIPKRRLLTIYSLSHYCFHSMFMKPISRLDFISQLIFALILIW